MAERTRQILGAAAVPKSIRRLAVIPADAEIDLLTFRRAGPGGVRPYWMASESDPETFAEDVKFRGLHPMVARRLQMWRLKNFEIRPLPSPGEVHLFDCVARDMPSDRRLIAVAEIRDVTPLRDDDGRVGGPSGGRARPRRLPGCDPAGAGRAPRRSPPGVEPGPALRLARRGPAPGRGQRGGAPPDAAHRGPGHRTGRGQRAAGRSRHGRTGGDGHAAGVRARSRPDGAAHGTIRRSRCSRSTTTPAS